MDSFLKQYCSEEWQKFVEFHIIKKKYKAKENIIESAELTRGLYIVNQGKVKVFSTDNDGKINLIRLAADGDILGHRGFGGKWTYPITATTYVDTEVSFIPINIFNIVAKANAEFTYHLMMFFAEELRKSEDNILEYSVKTRVCKSIIMNYKVFGFEKNTNKLSYTINRKDIANNSRTTYESVIRILSELNKEKVIKIDGKDIRILNLEILKKNSNS